MYYLKSQVMTNLGEVSSKIGVLIILTLKTTVHHIGACLQSCLGIFEKVKDLKNPQRKFEDFENFMKLVTDDEDAEAGKYSQL